MAVETLDYMNPLGQFHQMVDSMRDREQGTTRNTGIWSIILVIAIIAIFFFWNEAKKRNLDVAGTLGGLTQANTTTQTETAMLRNQLRYDEQFAFWERPSHMKHGCGCNDCCGHGGCYPPITFAAYGGGAYGMPGYGAYGSAFAYGGGVPTNGGLNGPFNYSHGYPVPEFKFKKVQEYEACGNPRIKETEVV